jgi:hypothetical protein
MIYQLIPGFVSLVLRRLLCRCFLSGLILFASICLVGESVAKQTFLIPDSDVDALIGALEVAEDGDIIALAPGAIYTLTSSYDGWHGLPVIGANGTKIST